MEKKTKYLSILIGFVFTSVFFIQTAKSQCFLNILASGSPLNCLTSLGNATATVLGAGTPPYSYTWMPIGGNNQIANNLPPGSYTVTVKDANGCTGTGVCIIINGTGINLNLFPTAISCFGANDGKLITQIQNATPPYNYSYNPFAPNSATVTNLGPGTYTVEVTDGDGCKHKTTAVVTQPSSITANTATTPITCANGTSGATVTTSGGTGPYTYSWTPIGNTTSVVPNINPGSYTVTIKDANGCTLVKPLTIVDPGSLSAIISSTNVTCKGFGNGKATVNASGGTGPYTYTWLPNNNNSTSISNLLPGSYTVIVKDANGCLKNQTVIITEPAALSYTIGSSPEFCINADGSASITVSGGTGPYSYSWTSSPPQTTSVAANLPSGNYSVHVTDANGCQTHTGVTVGNFSNLLPSITSKQNILCYATCSGTATASVSGGTGPYSFLWPALGSATTSAVTNLCQGTYTVKITDATGCYTQTHVTISEPGPISTSITGKTSLCIGQSSSLTAIVSGGIPTYTLSWEPGGLTGQTVTVTPSITTTYSITITDANGCVGTKLFNVNVADSLSLNINGGALMVCPNVNTSITVVANGGDGNYSYLWAPGNYSTSAITVNLQNSTIYTVTVSDGCGSAPITNTVNVGIYTVIAPTFISTAEKGCEPLCIQFTNTTPSITSVYWNMNDFDGAYITPAVTHCFNKAGKYTINMITTDIHGCKSNLNLTDFITVYGKPKADFIYSPLNVDLNNNEVTFKNSSLNTSQLRWTLDGEPMSEKGNVKHSFFETGCYKIKLYANNENFCSDSTEREICVNEGFNFWAPNAFSPDEDTKNDIFIPKGTGWTGDGYNFTIYNRWGDLIFQTHDTKEGWDGKYRGAEANDDIYVWKVFVKDLYGFEHEYIGKVYVMR